MITVFNRKEVLCTLSVKAQADARNRLKDAGVDYTVDIKDMTSSLAMNRSPGMGRFGENPKVSCEYRIFVHKNDYEKARHILNKSAD